MNISQSKTKSQFFFEVPEPEPGENARATVFRDPAAVPMLSRIAAQLRGLGYEVTEAKPGKACDAGCRVEFHTVSIALILFVRRNAEKVAFQLATWPVQSLRQRTFGRRIESPGDCQEWGRVCSAIKPILAGISLHGPVIATTFADGERASDWK